ncbi:MAG: RNA-guided pseudouridylation complex pseudouridine synthase subunit Cbf5 [Euryarchaeota archaeon]|uniref:rRNA pseudouridine synthase (DKC1, NOLA4, CBF5) n=3 Tax=environmental samples TaxID=68359 RepID=A0A075HTE0_9EURY|nr:tRNA pseudouridine synthase b (DKC1, NOLA4, CBF5) [uncultured marine group II/III euryarchaeote AD1000_22_E05]AIF04433.1 rRNA pseudouridine synthase (DKC1, NOLA4, CBF5) [uncultured marine group II/III euryarchaeote KM3_174_G08]AIF17148.1 rRNA pseudouridine synthase (DKC1, NOLA4, CBF5) [uncultured marine group II/III euryarchaeote KM3_76_C12]MAJ18767.1 RNA-guided pseudouridylation complex pseudouridine synthase subunit Cbf5 [Euryarchaeota archaeon]MCH1511398.1 RNA-guided pseudouridylation com|tara:strand:+ start:1650 stop:2615 length:966 start_codon:yes stop_codon:yes gene_type:complete
MIILDEKATTDSKNGCKPSERTLEQLLDAGVILVDKPRGPSSHQLTAWAREMLGIQRLGHGGTLDPFATGLLTMLCGKSTRLTEMVLTGDKRYIAVLRFAREVTQEELANLLESLQGEIYNVPPLESAVKVRVRTRILHDIRIIDADDESRTTAVTITCNAGTYIRTLARDFGLMLDTGCELLELHRDQTGSFDQSNACTMQQLTDAVFLWREHEDDRALRQLIAPVEAILGHLPRIVVKDGAAAAISHGAALARPGVVSLSEGIERGDLVVLESLKGEAVALAETNSAASKIASMQHGEVARPKVVLMQVGVYPQTWSKE